MASPILLIDVYNVLHVQGILPPDLAGIEVEGLVDLLCSSRWKACQITLVCDGTRVRGPVNALDDGAGGPQSFRVRGGERVRVVYAGRGKDADSHIEHLIETHSAPRRLLVVSSDRRLQVAARVRRAKSMSSEDLLKALVEDVRRAGAIRPGRSIDENDLGADEVQAWIEEFDLDEETLRAKPQGEPRHPDEQGAENPNPSEKEEEWRKIDNRDDLDMSKWIDSTEPLDDDS